jgi:hypothetical protein
MASATSFNFWRVLRLALVLSIQVRPQWSTIILTTAEQD